MAFNDVGALEEFETGRGRMVVVDGTPVAVFRDGERIMAIHAVCVHRGGPLGDGTMTGGKVLCPWHLWEYDLTSGRCLSNPDASVAAYEVRVDSGRVLVAVGPRT